MAIQHQGGFLGVVTCQHLGRGPSTLFWHRSDGSGYLATEGPTAPPARPGEPAAELLGAALDFASAWVEAIQSGGESDNADLFPAEWRPILGTDSAVFGAQDALGAAFPVAPEWSWEEYSPREALEAEVIQGEGCGSGGVLEWRERSPWEPEWKRLDIDAATLAELDRLAARGYWRAVDRLARAAVDTAE